jgi:thiamine pyrophosphate-dependent acetolactate synthase large subunit-like protein
MHAHTFARAADAQLSLRRALAHLSIARDLIQSVADDALPQDVRGTTPTTRSGSWKTPCNRLRAR